MCAGERGAAMVPAGDLRHRAGRPGPRASRSVALRPPRASLLPLRAARRTPQERHQHACVGAQRQRRRGGGAAHVIGGSSDARRRPTVCRRRRRLPLLRRVLLSLPPPAAAAAPRQDPVGHHLPGRRRGDGAAPQGGNGGVPGEQTRRHDNRQEQSGEQESEAHAGAAEERHGGVMDRGDRGGEGAGRVRGVVREGWEPGREGGVGACEGAHDLFNYRVCNI